MTQIISLASVTMLVVVGVAPVFGTQSYTTVRQSSCYGERYNPQSTLAAAKTACSSDPNCQGIYDGACNNKNFWLCPYKKPYTQSVGPGNTGSCIYQKTDRVFILV